MNFQTIAFNVYKNNSSLLGVSTVTMPELGWMTETVSGSGILGEIEMPSLGAISSMSITFNWISKSSAFFSMFNSLEANLLTLRNSTQSTDPITGLRSSQAIEITVQCEPKTGNLGTWDTGKKQDNSNSFEVTRIEVAIEGKTKLLIDKLNMIFMVNGIDQLAKVRRDLGMAV